MPVRGKHLVSALSPMLTEYIGYHSTDGSGDPTGTVTGYGTLTRTGTGTYQIAIDTEAPSILGVTVTLGRSAAADFQTQVIAVTAGASPTVTFRVLTGATEANFTSGTIYWKITIKQTGTPG